MEIKKVLMKDYSSLKIGGEGNLVVVKSKEELLEAVMYAETEGFRVHVLGSGTNTYFAENLSKYLFIKIEILGVSLENVDDNKTRVVINAGEIFDDIVKLSIENNLCGIENLSFIPGTSGAAPVQNIGAYGVELKDSLFSVRVLELDSKKFLNLSNQDCEFGYRDSIFKKKKGKYIITQIVLELSQEFKPNLSYKPLDSLLGKENISLKDIRDLVIKTRQTKLPDWKIYPNTGSFFKNPFLSKLEGDELRAKYENIPLHEVVEGYKLPAAWLIEHIACAKGMKEGNIGTWPNQPLVIVNYGESSALELNNFASKIQNKIEEKTGIKISKEVNFVE